MKRSELQTRHGGQPTNLGRCIRAFRTMNDLTLRDLAKKIGTSHATLMRIEQGYAMDAKTFMAVLNWLAVAERSAAK